MRLVPARLFSPCPFVHLLLPPKTRPRVSALTASLNPQLKEAPPLTLLFSITALRLACGFFFVVD